MSLLSGFNATLPEVGLLGEAAMAAFAGGAIPTGWNVITPQQLGIPPQYWDGIYFTNNGASAIVLQQGSTWIVSFRGTDGADDILQYPELVFGTYINHFQPLLSAVASFALDGTNFYFTGASLGGGATNLMANIAASQYGGEFASAHFVGFASPNISTANGILNIGFENDPVYKALGGYNNFSSSLDNLVLATPQYMQGNYDGLHPLDAYAHNADLAFDAFARLESSVFFNQMSPDSVVIFDAFSGTVQDITPGRENVGVFYLGENVADVIIGRNGDDHIEGFAGDDTLIGGLGNDILAGGADNDVYYVTDNGDQVQEGSGAGIDAVVASVNFTIPTNVEVLYENGSGLIGMGSSANDYLVSIGANTLIGDGGNDVFVLLRGQSSGTTIADFNGKGPDHPGDTLLFAGYSTADQGATLTPVDASHWSINSADGLTHDIITLLGGATVHQSDFLFV